jgi:carboxypeptidase PM20D1
MHSLKYVATAFGLLAAVLIFNTLALKPAPQAPAVQDLAAVDESAAAERLALALRVATVTHNERDRVDWSRWPVFHQHLARTYPGVHRELTRETVSNYSLLYTWPGSDPAAKPILLLAHQDVVPIEPGTEGTWEQPPFAGVINNGFIWGRGALDDKASLTAQLEAVELLLAQNFKPRRTVYFAFGHDEEIGGQEGAVKIAELLQSRGVKAEFSLDEGGALTQGVIAGISRPVATVATAEKGYVSFRLISRDAGGHSSRPPKTTAIGRLAQAVARLEQQQRPVRLAAPVDEMLLRLAPELPFSRRLALANLWLFKPLVARQMAGSPITNALVRTTTAPTMLNAGIKDNVLPVEASAVVNFRVLPGESVASVEAHLRKVMDNAQIEVAPLDFASEPSPVADPATPAFLALERTVNEVFPEAIVTTGLVIGATDNRHYGAVREARYNFLPVIITEGDLARVHGANERIAVDGYARMVRFYVQLLRNTAG